MPEIKPMLAETETRLDFVSRAILIGQELLMRENVNVETVNDDIDATIAVTLIDIMLKEKNEAQKIKMWDKIYQYIKNRKVHLHAYTWRKVLNDQVLFGILKKDIPSERMRGILINYGI